MHTNKEDNMKTDREIELANTLEAIGRGWVVGYTKQEIEELKKEHLVLVNARKLAK